MKKLNIIIVLLITVGFGSCGKYLDIVPDNVATLENAFAMRNTAERYLFTCYSYLPQEDDINSSPSFIGGELWQPDVANGFADRLGRGGQNVTDPLINFWDGANGGKDMFQGIRNCNIFLEHINSVPDMIQFEKDRWSAEVKFLKAYYHFVLVRSYGPIPLVRKNLPIDAGLDEVRVSREPVDTCFNYIVRLLDEAIPFLPLTITDEASELGRITKPIAESVKALVLVTAASPLFNGNTDYARYIDNNGVVLFNQNNDLDKWRLAMEACIDAMDICNEAGLGLYKFQQPTGMPAVSDATLTKMSIRNAVCEEWNKEQIWTWTGAVAVQTALTPRTWDPAHNYLDLAGRAGPPVNIMNDLFYTNHGVPIDEDKDWDYNGRFEIKTAQVEDRYNIKEGYQTVAMHFNREPRFYATTGFDGGIWYGQGRFDDLDTWHLEGRQGGYTSPQTLAFYSPTGYWPKKLISYKNVVIVNGYSVDSYYWPNMRLADLYLLYAEATNEYQNKIRERAGLPTVEEAWTQYSRNPTKFQSKDGLREIIHQERQIELAYESKRFWDLLRWKTAQTELSKPILGWDLNQKSPELYYRETLVYEREFKKRDYFWPIRESDIIKNKNLMQSPGW